jgi:tRNA G18 (ribose-2'-O)-methylase SpoU
VVCLINGKILLDKTIKIPMLGSLDSMNVSVAAGIILFEVCRQRKINHITS